MRNAEAPEVFVGGVVVPHPFKEWPGHAACADCHGARYARLGDDRPLHPLPRHLTAEGFFEAQERANKARAELGWD